VKIISKKALEKIAGIGSEFTFEEALAKTGYSQSTLKKILNNMVKERFLIRRNSKFIVTEELKFIIEGIKLKDKIVNERSAYVFTDEKGIPIPLRIDTIEKLYIAIKYGFVPKEVVELHIEKGYIAKWLREVFAANELANKVENIKNVEEFLRILETYLEV